VLGAKNSDLGNQVAGFLFGDETSLLGEKKAGIIDRRRNRPRKDDAGDGLHGADGCPDRRGFESLTFHDEGVRKNVLFDSSRVACKKVRRPAIRLIDFFTRQDDEHHPTLRVLARRLKPIERLLRLRDRRRAAPPQEKNRLLDRANNVLMLVDDLHEAQVTKLFALRKANCQLRFEAS
jgi:hypothetical protein